MSKMKQFWPKKRVIGRCTLYLADCFKLLSHLPKVDAVITDPPYGINYKSHLPGAQIFDGLRGDSVLIDLRPVLTMNCFVLSWGG